MGAEGKVWGRFWKGALGLIYPPQCPACDTPVGQESALCPACWREAGFITGPSCDCCGLPLPSDGSGEGAALCDDCLRILRPWTRGAAALTYAGTGRKLVLALKHGDRPDLARVLGDWLADAARPLRAEGMVLVPVPVHPARMVRRRYNQAALIAAQLARRLDLPHLPGALRRTRNTPMQDHRSLADRFANQSGAIAVRVPAALAGRPVLLVDDVMASGATMSAAAEALGAAGAGPVSVAVVARALREGRIEADPNERFF